MKTMTGPRCYACDGKATWSTIGERACDECMGLHPTCGICCAELVKVSSKLAFGRVGECFKCPNCKAKWSHSVEAHG